MMRTRTIATGAGITGSADCPQAFIRRVVSSAGPLALCGLLPRRRSTIRLNHSHMQIAHTLTLSLIPGPSVHRPRPPPPRSGGTCASRLPALTHPPACACLSPRLPSLRVDLAPLHPRVATAVAGAITADGWPRRRPQSPPRGCGTSAVQTACDLEEEPRYARDGSTPEGGCSRHVRPHSSPCQASLTPLCSAAAARFAARRLSRSACFAAFLFPNACSERVASRAAVPETPLPGAPASCDRPRRHLPCHLSASPLLPRLRRLSFPRRLIGPVDVGGPERSRPRVADARPRRRRLRPLRELLGVDLPSRRAH